MKSAATQTAASFRAVTVLLTAFALFFFATPVSAQFDVGYTPTEGERPGTPAADIALIYYKVAGMFPNFEELAAGMDDVKAASDFEKRVLIERQAAELRSQFSLVAASEPVTIRTTLKLSEYSFGNKGYMVDSFTPELIFPYVYAGKNFAIVVPGLMDAQWLSVPDEEAVRRIETALAETDREIHANIIILPQSADRAPLPIEGEDFYLLSGGISNIVLFSPDRTEKIWEKDAGTTVDPLQNEIFNLKQ